MHAATLTGPTRRDTPAPGRPARRRPVPSLPNAAWVPPFTLAALAPFPSTGLAAFSPYRIRRGARTMDSLRVVVTDHQRQRVVCDRTFDRYPVRIGRDAASDLHLDYPFISARHAEVRREADALRLCDLGARNRLAVGPRKLPQGGVLLGERAVATIGPLELRFDRAGPVPEPLPAQAAVAGIIDDLPRIPAADSPHAARLARPAPHLDDLRPRHAAVVRARDAWERALHLAVSRLGDDDAAALLAEFPAPDRPHLLAGASTDPSPQPLSLLPDLPLPTDEADRHRLLARAGDVLRIFAACTLELNRLRAEQAAALGTPWDAAPGPLAALDAPDDALRHLLDARADATARNEELVHLFTGLADHQRALARAALEAAREVVGGLAPAEIEAGAPGAWPSRAAAVWRHYQACFAALLGESHDHLTPTFRASLARAYARALARAGVRAA